MHMPSHHMHTHLQDGFPSSWSAAELSDLLSIWRGVSEDFAPWEVCVFAQWLAELRLLAEHTAAALLDICQHKKP